MFFETLVIGLLALCIGMAFCFAGYKYFRILIAIWGLFAGFLIAAQGITELFGGGFLSTALGWIAGLLLGLVLAGLAYFLYTAAIVILSASVGYWLGTGLMVALGFGNQATITIIAGVVVAILLAFLTIAFNLTKLLIIVNMALGGASTIVAGILLLLGIIPLEYLSLGTVGAIVRGSWFWGLVWLLLALVGTISQQISTQKYTQNYVQTQF